MASGLKSDGKYEYSPLLTGLVFLDELFDWAEERAAYHLLLADDTTRETKRRVQVALLEEASLRFGGDLSKCFDTTKTQLGQSVENRIGKLQGHLGSAKRSGLRRNIAAECLSLARRVRHQLDRTIELAPGEKQPLDGLILLRAAQIDQRGVDGVGASLRSIRAAIKAASDAVRDGLADDAAQELVSAWGKVAIAALGGNTVFASIGAKVLVADDPSYQAAGEVRTFTWSFAHTMKELLERVFDRELFVDVYFPGSDGDLVLEASTRQTTPPTAPPTGFSKTRVARRHLQGGAGGSAHIPLVNDVPDEFTSSNHQAEGAPHHTISVPLHAPLWPAEFPGQVFVGILDEGPPVSNDATGLVAAVFLLVSRFSRELGGQPEYPWHYYLRKTRPYADFLERLRGEVERAVHSSSEMRTGFIVVASKACSAQERHSVSHILDGLARFTAIRLADGEDVYALEQPASGYVFIREDATSAKWDRLSLDGRATSHHRFVLPIAGSDGTPAGVLGMWSVLWKDSYMQAARDRLHEPELVRIIESQVGIASQEFESLNRLHNSYARGDYLNAYSIVRRLVDRYPPDCSVVLSDAQRLAMLNQDFAGVLNYSEMRLSDAPWDLDAHANKLMGLLAQGALLEALDKLNTCAVCRDYVIARDPRELPHPEYPMLTIAKCVALILNGTPEVPEWDMFRAIGRTLADLAPRELGLRDAVKDVLLSLIQLRDRSWATRVDAAIRQLNESALDDAQPRNWHDRESLRRIALMLKCAAERGAGLPPLPDCVRERRPALVGTGVPSQP